MNRKLGNFYSEHSTLNSSAIKEFTICYLGSRMYQNLILQSMLQCKVFQLRELSKLTIKGS